MLEIRQTGNALILLFFNASREPVYWHRLCYRIWYNPVIVYDGFCSFLFLSPSPPVIFFHIQHAIYKQKNNAFQSRIPSHRQRRFPLRSTEIWRHTIVSQIPQLALAIWLCVLMLLDSNREMNKNNIFRDERLVIVMEHRVALINDEIEWNQTNTNMCVYPVDLITDYH